MKNVQRLTAEQKQQIQYLWIEGARVEDIASAVGCAVSTVSSQRVRLGLPPRPYGRPAVRNRATVAALADLYGPKRVARWAGLTVSCVTAIAESAPGVIQ